MIPFERRQQILALLQEQPGIKVSELARQLDVSEGTIRNDLSALEEEGRLTRVRGGAVPRHGHRFISSLFAEHARTHAEAKRRIARYAAELVEDGDSILLDASSTVFALVPHLHNRHNLTIVTNGIEVALALASNRSLSVILVGGVMRSDGTSVVGHLGEKILDELHFKMAFVSCSGFSVEAGLTEVDIQEVQLKKKMVRSADRVIALIDSSKFGRVDLTSFASLEQIAHIFTDDALSPQFVEQLRRTGTALTLCGEHGASQFLPYPEEKA